MHIKYNDNNDTYVIDGFFGMFFRSVVKNSLGIKADLLFRKYGLSTIEFDAFFSLEVKIFLEFILNKYTPTYNLNASGIKKAITLIESTTWLNNKNKPLEKLDYSIVDRKLKFKIMDHQHQAFEDYLRIKRDAGLRGMYLHGEPGVGKTFISLALCELLRTDRVVIIAPLESIEQVWTKSLETTVYKNKQSIYGTGNLKQDFNNEKFVLMHYEAISKFIPTIKGIRGNNTVVIIDEFHNFNERDTNRLHKLMELLEGIDSNNIILLSGTPIKAKPLEMVNMIKILDNKYNKVVDKRFQKIYRSPSSFFLNLVPERYGLYTTHIAKKDLKLPKLTTEFIYIKIPNYKDYLLTTIKTKIENYINTRTDELNKDKDMYVNTYNELMNKSFELAFENGDTTRRELEEYKQNIETIIKAYDEGKLMYISETMKNANDYEKLLSKYLGSEDKKLFKEAKTIVKYLMLKIRGEVLGRIISRERINCHRDMAKHLKYEKLIDSTHKKTLIFTNNIEVADEAVKACGVKYNPARVYGKYKKDLDKTINEFTENKDINPLIAVYKSLATAVPVIAANVMVCLDLPFRAYLYEQAIARIWRLGQDSPVTIYQIYLDTGEEKSINSRGFDIIAWSKNQVEYITGIDSDLEFADGDSDKSNKEYEELDDYKPKEYNNLINRFKDDRMFNRFKQK